MTRRVLLLIPTTSYKARDFLAAAERMQVQVVVGTNRRQALEDAAPGNTLTLDFTDLTESLERIVAEHRQEPFCSVLGVDDEATVLAAEAANALGLPHNPAGSVRAARDKYETRKLISAAGLRSPWFFRVAREGGVDEAAARARYPCVLKPICLSASRGVIRADNRKQLRVAFERIASILRSPAVLKKGGDLDHVLVEEYLPGQEVALEGLLDRGRLAVLALFDKPDPLEGPTFEETIYVTPSRLTDSLQSTIVEETAQVCRVLGLREGPVHAELRVRDGQCWLLEVAARTIGGLCSRVLRFASGLSLEEVVLRHALKEQPPSIDREQAAAGVMMIPVPRAGVLRDVVGLEQARSEPLVDEVTLTTHRGAELVPPPDGDRYLGFIFARGAEPQAVESALRRAHARLSFAVD
jgi:biotin carboxylase